MINKKDKKIYDEMLQRHREGLIELSEKYDNWDYGYLNDFVFTIIRNMYEYYSKGINVVQTEEYRQRVITKLKEIIDKIEAYENCEGLLEEYKLIEEVYTLIGKNIVWFWD